MWKIKEYFTKQMSFKDVLKFLWEISVYLIIWFLISRFVVSFSIISWTSMVPTFKDKDVIIINSVPHLISSLYMNKQNLFKRNDIVVIEPHTDVYRKKFIKRIIWISWDTIKIENWYVYLKEKGEEEFKKLNESFLWEESLWQTFSSVIKPDENPKEYIVPENEYFLLWDNRTNSVDSRSCFHSCSFGNESYFLKKDYIIWTVLYKFSLNNN